MNSLTVILPAAGKGTRLNLPYPKELMCVDLQTSLIDHSFRLFQDYDKSKVNFVIVIDPSKTSIVEYVHKYAERYNISFTFQRSNYAEYTGAIKSAFHLMGENNLVLLPDSIITMQENQDLFRAIQSSLEQKSFAFICKLETRQEILKTKGCLRLNRQNQVIEYEDKPINNLLEYNAYWCGFAFRKSVFSHCITFMEQSTLGNITDQIHIKETELYGSEAIKVKDYRDLGTWDELRNYFINPNINKR